MKEFLLSLFSDPALVDFIIAHPFVCASVWLMWCVFAFCIFIAWLYMDKTYRVRPSDLLIAILLSIAGPASCVIAILIIGCITIVDRMDTTHPPTTSLVGVFLKFLNRNKS